MMMKTGRAAMWANRTVCGALLLVLGLAGGCGKAESTESGETHFVTCESDADCSDVAGAHTCSGGVCRGPANDSETSVDTPACSSGCGASECAAPGACTLAAACKLVDCGTALVDDDACVRPSCESDADCANDERCTALWSGKHEQCVQRGDSCECSIGLGLYPVNLCSPVSLAGMRGQWQKLVVTEEVLGDSTVRTFYPDGSITIEQRSLEADVTVRSTAQLSAEDLDDLTRQVNGPFLRLELANPTPCPTTKARDDIVDLYLSDASANGSAMDTPALSKNVAGCLNPPDDVIPFSNLIGLASKY